MGRPRRASATEGPFRDPLGDYSEQTFEDPLERALHDEQVTDLWTKHVATVSPDATIEQAMRQMNALGVSCVLVVEGEKLVGVFNERNVLNQVAHCFAEIKNDPVERVMTREPVVLHESDKAGTALGAIGVGRARHVPVLDINDRVLGVASPRCIVAFLRRHFIGGLGAVE